MERFNRVWGYVMKESFWAGNGKGAWSSKVVVSQTGHAIAKNYQASDLRKGDIGVTIRLDREMIKVMTDEQRLAAQGLVEEMSRALLVTLGKVGDEGSGFSPGQVILVIMTDGSSDVFRLERESKAGIHVREIDLLSLGDVRFVPWQSIRGIEARFHDSEEMFQSMGEELHEYLLRVEPEEETECYAPFPRRACMKPGTGFIRRFVSHAAILIQTYQSTWGEDALQYYWMYWSEFVVRYPTEHISSEEARALTAKKGSCYYVDDVPVRYNEQSGVISTTVEHLFPLLRITTSKEKLEELVAKATDDLVRQAAAIILAER